MGFMLDLDECTDRDLRDELRRRRALRVEGKCDYCGRSPNTSACKFPERHVLKKEREPLLWRFLQFLRFQNKERFVLPSSNLQRVIDDFRAKSRS